MTGNRVLLRKVEKYIGTTTKVIAIVLTPFVYFFSYYLLSHYTGGDQISYHKFYDALHGARIEEIMFLALVYVSSVEPLSAFILWLGSNLGFEKNVYISLLNVILIVSLFLLARQHQVRMLMIGLLLTNFYVVMLMTGGERLKIAYIFFILATLFVNKMRFLFLSLSPLAHLQSIILLAGVMMAHFEGFILNLLFRFSISKRSLGLLIVIFVVGATIGYYLFDGIKNKANTYAFEEFSPFELINLGILSVIALYVSHKRFRMFLVLLPTIPAIAILGGMRVNMIAVSLVIYYLMEERRLHHPLVYLLMAYFSIKTIPFVNKIILYGDGFAS
jgi:hypothetical protein